MRWHLSLIPLILLLPLICKAQKKHHKELVESLAFDQEYFGRLSSLKLFHLHKENTGWVSDYHISRGQFNLEVQVLSFAGHPLTRIDSIEQLSERFKSKSDYRFVGHLRQYKEHTEFIYSFTYSTDSSVIVADLGSYGMGESIGGFYGDRVRFDSQGRLLSVEHLGLFDIDRVELLIYEGKMRRGDRKLHRLLDDEKNLGCTSWDDYNYDDDGLLKSIDRIHIYYTKARKESDGDIVLIPEYDTLTIQFDYEFNGNEIVVLKDSILWCQIKTNENSFTGAWNNNEVYYTLYNQGQHDGLFIIPKTKASRSKEPEIRSLKEE